MRYTTFRLHYVSRRTTPVTRLPPSPPLCGKNKRRLRLLRYVDPIERFLVVFPNFMARTGTFRTLSIYKHNIDRLTYDGDVARCYIDC